jgi:uncharacterized membrane protein
MKKVLQDIAITGVILSGLDFLYLSQMEKSFELKILGIQKSPMNIKYSGLILCYLFLILGLYYFVIREQKSILYAFLLGIFVYGVYELTNYATINKWGASFAFMDTIWGGILFALTTFIFQQIKKLRK